MKIVSSEEHESATKTMRIIAVQQRLAENNVNVEKLSQQEFDEVIRWFDEGDKINTNANNQMAAIKSKAEQEIQQVSIDTQQKMAPLTKKFYDFVATHKEQVGDKNE